MERLCESPIRPFSAQELTTDNTSTRDPHEWNLRIDVMLWEKGSSRFIMLQAVLHLRISSIVA